LLSSGTTYYFKISAVGLSGTATADNNGNYYVFKTTAEALTISNVQVTNVTNNSATISWTTNQASVGTVMYGTSKPPLIPAPSTASGTSHSTTLSLLSSGTTYYFKISAVGLSGTATADNNGNYYVFKTTSGVPASISIVSGNNQSAPRGSTLSPFVVVVKDSNNNPVPNVTVNWSITIDPYLLETRGSLSTTSGTTGSNGQASSTLTLGNGYIGGLSYTVTASVSGYPLLFTLFTATAT
jgi:predicted RNA-binding protein with TRAM domain